MAAKKFTRLTGSLQASALQQAEPDRLFGGSRQGMRLVEPRLEDIDLNPDQPRRHFDPSELSALADSIAVHGQKQPIGVRQQENGRWLLIFGERRYRACSQLGQATIQAVVTDGDPLEVALIENLQRADLTVFETADAYNKLMKQRNYNRSTLAKVMGTTPGAITRLLAIADLPGDIRQEWETDYSDISKSLLMELAEITDPVLRTEIWAAIKAGATVRDIRTLKGAGAAPVFPLGGDGQGDGQSAESSEFGQAAIDSVPSESVTVQMSEIKPATKPADPLTQSVNRLEKLVKPYQDGRLLLEQEHRNRLLALRGLIDGLLNR